MLHVTLWELSLAETYLVEGQAALAREHVARAHSNGYGEKYLAPEIDRLEALLLQREGSRIALVQEYLLNGLSIARQQGARLLELHSATSLARVLGEHSQRRMAIDILAPIYAWFTEGFDTADLRQAKALLDELN